MFASTSQSPREEMEDSVDPGIRVTKETENWILSLQSFFLKVVLIFLLCYNVHVFFLFLTFILLLESYVHSGASACGCTQVAFSVFERAATPGKRNSSPVISFVFNC